MASTISDKYLRATLLECIGHTIIVIPDLEEAFETVRSAFPKVVRQINAKNGRHIDDEELMLLIDDAIENARSFINK